MHVELLSFAVYKFDELELSLVVHSHISRHVCTYQQVVVCCDTSDHFLMYINIGLQLE